MKITKIDKYKDGGTIKILTTDKIYCIDSRIGTKTKGVLYFDYPNKENSNIVPNQDEIKSEIKKVLDNYTDTSYFRNFDSKSSIIKLLDNE